MTLDPQAKDLLEKVEQSGIPPYETMTPEMARKYYEKACEVSSGNPPEPFQVSEIQIPGPAQDIPALVYRPNEKSGLPILVFFHGGGYTIGSPQSHDAVCRHLCVEAECLVVSVDYRLGPEHKFPAATEDAFAATCWVADNAVTLGGDPNLIAVGGDSAGGNLSTVTCLMARETGFPKIIYQLLIYPGTDMTGSFPSHQSCGEGYLLTKSLLKWFHFNYIPKGSDLKNWKCSPLHAEDHSNLPAAHVITAGFDPLQDEGKAYAEKLKTAGVEVSTQHYPGMLHGFITQPGFIDKAREALTECSDKLRASFSAAKV